MDFEVTADGRLRVDALSNSGALQMIAHYKQVTVEDFKAKKTESGKYWVTLDDLPPRLQKYFESLLRMLVHLCIGGNIYNSSRLSVELSLSLDTLARGIEV